MAAAVVLLIAVILSDHQKNGDGSVCNHCKVCEDEPEKPMCIPDPFAVLLKKLMFMEKIPESKKDNNEMDQIAEPQEQPCEPEEGVIPVFPLPHGIKLSREGILPYNCNVQQQDEFSGPPASPLHGIHKELPVFIIPLTEVGATEPTHYVPVFPKLGRKFDRSKRMLKRKRAFDDEDAENDENLSTLTDEQRKSRKEQSWKEKCGKYRSEDFDREFDEDQEEGWSQEYDLENEDQLKGEEKPFKDGYRKQHRNASEDEVNSAWKGKCRSQKAESYKKRKYQAWNDEKENYEKEVTCVPDEIEVNGEEVDDEECYEGITQDDEREPKEGMKSLFRMFVIPVLSPTRPRPENATEFSHFIQTQKASTMRKSDNCLLNSFTVVPTVKQGDGRIVITGTSSGTSVLLEITQLSDGTQQLPLIPVVRRPHIRRLMDNFQMLSPLKQTKPSGNSLMVIFPMPKRRRDLPVVGFAPLFATPKEPVCTREELMEMNTQKKKRYGLSRCCKADEKPTCPEMKFGDDDDADAEPEIQSEGMKAQLVLRMNVRQVVLNIATLAKRLLKIATKTNRSDRVAMLYACPEFSCPGGTCPATAELRTAMGCVEFELYGAPPRASIQSASKTIVAFSVHSEFPGDVYQSIVNEINAAIEGEASELSQFPVEELSFQDPDEDNHHHRKSKKVWCYIVVISIAVIAISVAGLSIWCCCCKKAPQTTETTTIHVIHASPTSGKVMDPVELRAIQKAVELDESAIPQGIVISSVPGTTTEDADQE